MARSWLTSVVSATLAVTGMGCGTMGNLHRDQPPFCERPTIYGGIREDVSWGSGLLAHGFGGWDGLLGRAVSLAVVPYVFCIDLPLSAVGDTLTLPITVRASIHTETTPSPISTAGERGGKDNSFSEHVPANEMGSSRPAGE